MFATPAVSRRVFCTSALCCPLVGCAGKPPSRGPNAVAHQEEYRGPLVDPKEIPGDFMWQQRVAATHGANKGAFDAVVQKKGAELLILGLTPMNTRGFSLTQRGRSIEYKQFVPFELPFRPASVLYDIHRAFFYNLLKPFPSSGTRHSTFEEERVTDEFSEGRLLTRLFEEVSGSKEDLKIDYAPLGYSRGIPPEITIIDNRAYGYRLVVTTNSTRAL